MNCRKTIPTRLLYLCIYHHSSPGSGRSGGSYGCKITGKSGFRNEGTLNGKIILHGMDTCKQA